MEVVAETFEPLELHFSDLLSLSSSSSSSSSCSNELERLEGLRKTIMETLGPSGTGLLAITGVPGASHLRRTLLPLARNLALLPNDRRRAILRENCLGSDVPLKNPDRTVSSFSLQLKYMQDLIMEQTVVGSNKDDLSVGCLHESQDCEFKKLREILEEIGVCMMKLGLKLARICDMAIGGHELEQSILDSHSAKGRLIHYHSVTEILYLKELGRNRTKQSTKGQMEYHHLRPTLHDKEVSLGPGNNNGDALLPMEDVNTDAFANRTRFCQTSLSNLWQQWHYDYGIFTVLTDPMFMSPCEPQTKMSNDCFHVACAQECSSPYGHTHLQIFDTNKNKVLLVNAPPESFIVQVGESADILSKGILRSTLHSVCRPVETYNLSRETFVVFLQPAWEKAFDISGFPLTALVGSLENSAMDKDLTVSNKETSVDSDSSSIQSDQKSHYLTQEILRTIPPLSNRLKDGMTFAEFSRETTKQYYGGSGMQSKR